MGSNTINAKKCNYKRQHHTVRARANTTTQSYNNKQMCNKIIPVLKISKIKQMYAILSMVKSTKNRFCCTQNHH